MCNITKLELELLCLNNLIIIIYFHRQGSSINIK